MTKTKEHPGKQAAETLKDRANWDGKFPVDLYAVAKAVGLEVREDSSLVDRCVLKTDETPPILLQCGRGKADLGKLRMSGAEAIGRYVMGKCTDAEVEDFAAVLLMPTEELLDLVMAKKLGFKEVAAMVQVTEKDLAKRLNDLGVVIQL